MAMATAMFPALDAAPVVACTKAMPCNAQGNNSMPGWGTAGTGSKHIVHPLTPYSNYAPLGDPMNPNTTPADTRMLQMQQEWDANNRFIDNIRRHREESEHLQTTQPIIQLLEWSTNDRD